MRRNKLPIMLNNPNWCFPNLNRDIKENAIRNGNPRDAITYAVSGSGLNSKKSVFEKGSDKDEIIPDADSQTGIIAKTFKKFGSLFLKEQVVKNLEIPIAPPKLHNNIPNIKVMWGGLKSPSNPKFECQKKSKGPAPVSMKIPINFIFNGIEKKFFSPFEFLHPKKDTIVPINEIATPTYIIA